MSAVIDWQGATRQTCPDCGRSERDRTLGVTVEAGRGVAHCFRCGYVETLRDERTERRPGKPVSRPVAPLKRETLSQYGLELFGACIEVHSTIGEQYLLARGCVIPPADGDLRFHPALRHPSGYVGPALVALVTHAVTREPMTLHRTWVRADGTKADCDPPRLLLGGHVKKHGVIRLWPDECVTYGLAVAEGVESALSLALAYQPVWACIDAGNMAALPVLAGIETLIVGADHDPAGIKAAGDCADRWAAAGVDVRVIAPATQRADWNDRRAA
ncbi:MAG: toprim domain-containing protein [Rubrivivax sp.]|nr:toprim domain-containing protein [Rubrivivax sp.]